MVNIETVEDDDDDEEVVEEETIDEVVDEAEAFLAAAEARRKRILEKSKERMGVVSGGTEGEIVVVAAAAEGGEADGEGAEGEGGGAADSSEEPKEKKPSNMSKYQAARRRRFQKKKVAAAASTEESASEEKKEREEEKPAAAVATTATTTTTEATTTTTETTTTSTSSSSNSTARKYQGVAAVRRKKALERQEALKKETSLSKSTTETIEKIEALKKQKKPSVFLPVFLQFITILLLVIAGLDIALFDANVKDEGVVVHTNLSVQDNGVGLITKYFPNGDDSGEKKKSIKDNLNDMMFASSSQDASKTDEFGSGEDDDDGGDDPSNIDPLFQVDLDKYTKGPGLIMMAGRFAVYVHRNTFLYFFYTLPMTILAIPKAIVNTPPTFFLLCMLIRLIFKRLLGAKIPKDDSDDNEGDPNAPKDVLSTLKNTVINFLSNSFPTMVVLYETYTDLRADMYIVMCGFFIGLAYKCSMSMSNSIEQDEKQQQQGGITTDEL